MTLRAHLKLTMHQCTCWQVSKLVVNFLKMFLEDISPSCMATDTPVWT